MAGSPVYIIKRNPERTLVAEEGSARPIVAQQRLQSLMTSLCAKKGWCDDHCNSSRAA